MALIIAGGMYMCVCVFESSQSCLQFTSVPVSFLCGRMNVCVHSPVLVVSGVTVGDTLLLYSCSQVQLTEVLVDVMRCK